ncbi:MAG: hypothetical protein LBK95_05660 [Bifidobacteriaceae bacterium]|nr:hypothetical protein [Bifidobacteriaceae bacterium]
MSRDSLLRTLAVLVFAVAAVLAVAHQAMARESIPPGDGDTVRLVLHVTGPAVSRSPDMIDDSPSASATPPSESGRPTASSPFSPQPTKASPASGAGDLPLTGTTAAFWAAAAAAVAISLGYAMRRTGGARTPTHRRPEARMESLP